MVVGIFRGRPARSRPDLPAQIRGLRARNPPSSACYTPSRNARPAPGAIHCRRPTTSRLGRGLRPVGTAIVICPAAVIGRMSACYAV